jgi:hypothetical protein
MFLLLRNSPLFPHDFDIFRSASPVPELNSHELENESCEKAEAITLKSPAIPDIERLRPQKETRR